ncbi:MAG: transcriptional regulator GlxA family with amidase domain [Oleispira sp.]|jgi:transcriptional regulator GlxA family with amidase domain
MTSISVRHVTILALEQMLGSSAANPMEMLEAARARLKVNRANNADFKIDIAAPEMKSLSLLGGFQVRPNCVLSEIEATDLIVVPALWRNPANTIRNHKDTTIPWLRNQYLAGASIMAVGTGVSLVAEAGILDGKAATTHWHYLEQFSREYPRVNLQTKHLLTQSGRIYCAASVSSAADMMIHWLGLVFGKDLSLQVEQQFSPEVRNTFETKVFHAEMGNQHPDEEVANVQRWLQQNLSKGLNVTALSRQAGLSTRQLSRRFKSVCGKTLGQYQQYLRCLEAKDLLKNTDMAVADIGMALGYSDISHFGRIFHRHFEQSPKAYRDKVRHKLFVG